MIRALALLALTTPALATEAEVATYGPLLEQCYAEAEGREAKEQCIGALSQACQEGEEGGYSTLGMSICNAAETAVWDRFLNAEYRETMAVEKATDAAEREAFPEFAKREESLRAAQRAWIAFRDAECSYHYAQWGSGSMRNIAASACVMELTAQRTLDLAGFRSPN